MEFQINMFKKEVKLQIGIGKILATSTSKIRKIIVRMKNRSEKEARILWFGSKPHSNGLFFSFILCFSLVFSRVEIALIASIRIITKIITLLFIIIF